MSRSAEGAVGSIRRSGRPAPSQQTRPLQRVPPRQPPLTRPAGRPGRTVAPSSRRPCRRAQVGLSTAPVQSASRPEETPSLRPLSHRRSGGRPARALSGPGRTLRRPPAAESLPLPPAHCPPETPRAPHLTAPGISAALPSRPGPPFRPAPAGETALPAACPLIGAARFHARPGRPAVGETFLRPFCPTALSARALRPARVPFRPQAGPFCRQRDAFILWRPNMELG